MTGWVHMLKMLQWLSLESENASTFLTHRGLASELRPGNLIGNAGRKLERAC